MQNMDIGALEFFKHNRGTICVFRDYLGCLEVLRLDNQKGYKEWGGCFSIL